MQSLDLTTSQPLITRSTRTNVRIRLMIVCLTLSLHVVSAEAQESSKNSSRSSDSARHSTLDPRLLQHLENAQRSQKALQPESGNRPAPRTAVAVESARTTERTRIQTAEQSEFEVVPPAETRQPGGAGIERASFEQPQEQLTPQPAPLRATPAIAQDIELTETSANSPGTTQSANADKGSMFLDLRGSKPSADNASGDVTTGAEVTMESNPAQVLTRAVAWVVIALCLFSLAALGVRRWQRQRGLLPASNSRSRVLETLSLGPGRSVSLIEIAGYRALVASDAGGIRQLILASASFQDEMMEAENPENEKLAA